MTSIEMWENINLQLRDAYKINQKLITQNKIMREALEILCSGEFRDNNVDGIANEALQKCSPNNKNKWSEEENEHND